MSADDGTTVKYDCIACRNRRMYCLGDTMVGSCEPKGEGGRPVREGGKQTPAHHDLRPDIRLPPPPNKFTPSRCLLACRCS